MFKSNLNLKETREKYLAFFKSLNTDEEFYKILQSDDLAERRELWTSIKSKLPAVEQRKFANPFFIGYGNPTADILFLGKEKAFDIEKDEHNLFLKESINNILQWEKVVSSKSESLIDFDPKFPRKAFPDLRYQDTWGTYSKIIKFMFEKENLSFNEMKVFEKSFLSKCFLTEINYMPSKYSDGKYDKQKGYSERIAFLKNEILPNFKLVIIGASTYFNTTNPEKLHQELFSLFGEIKENKTAHYLDRLINPFLHFTTVNGKQNIFLTTQLSGMNRWDDFKLKAFADRMKLSY